MHWSLLFWEALLARCTLSYEQLLPVFVNDSDVLESVRTDSFLLLFLFYFVRKK